MSKLLLPFSILLWASACNTAPKQREEKSSELISKDSLSAEVPRTNLLKGTLCYPSDYIPAMTIYLKEVNSDTLFTLTTSIDQEEFEFVNVPSGEYYAYAYTIEEESIDADGSKSRAGGGFTYAVLCGLSVDCLDHSLIVIKLSGNTTETIQLCDWYGAIIPEEN